MFFSSYAEFYRDVLQLNCCSVPPYKFLYTDGEIVVFKPWPRKALSACCDFTCCTGRQTAICFFPSVRGRLLPWCPRPSWQLSRKRLHFQLGPISVLLTICMYSISACLVNLVCQLCWPGWCLSLCFCNNWLKNSNSECWNLNSYRFSNYCNIRN